MADNIKIRDGRIFVQQDELESYKLAQCSGLTDWNKPRGAVTPIREQSLTKIGEEEIVDYVRASADMASFTLQTRFKEFQNWLLTQNCDVNVQVCFKDCGDPMNYYGFNMGLAWARCPLGDLTGDPLAIIEGDDVPININNPFQAIYGPYLVDFKVKFTSRRNIAETGGVNDIFMFAEECLADCLFRAGNGQYGYAVCSSQPGSIVDAANVWFTINDGDDWYLVSDNPFAAGEDISCVVVSGEVSDHRIIVSRGETDAGNPAEIAYADVTVIGQTDWVNVDVGAVNGEYINYMVWPVYSKLFAITDQGHIYRSIDGGATWALSYDHTAVVELNDITATKRGIVWVAGDGDLLVYSDDYGETWTVVDGPNDGLLNLNTCWVDEDRKLCVGDSGGHIYGSVDEGLNWVETPPQGVVSISTVRIRGQHTTHFKWAIVDLAATAPAPRNSRVLRSTDGGANWRLWSLAQNAVPNYGLNALFCVDVNRVLAGGEPYAGTAFLVRTDTNIDKLLA